MREHRRRNVERAFRIRHTLHLKSVSAPAYRLKTSDRRLHGIGGDCSPMEQKCTKARAGLDWRYLSHGDASWHISESAALEPCALATPEEGNP